MSDLVILDRKSGIPVMDSRVAARELGIDAKSMNQLIADQESALGVCRFENAKPPKGSKGGRPERYYLLTERQALLLITMVRNSPEALVAKERLVDAFLAMRAVIQAREVAVAVRRELTDAIQGSPLNEAMHGWAYKQITDLIYRVVLGMDARHFREAKGLPKEATVREHLTQVQLVSVERLERLAGSMVDLGADYSRIKTAIAAFGLSQVTDGRAA